MEFQFDFYEHFVQENFETKDINLKLTNKINLKR